MKQFMASALPDVNQAYIHEACTTLNVKQLHDRQTGFSDSRFDALAHYLAALIFQTASNADEKFIGVFGIGTAAATDVGLIAGFSDADVKTLVSSLIGIKTGKERCITFLHEANRFSSDRLTAYNGEIPLLFLDVNSYEPKFFQFVIMIYVYMCYGQYAGSLNAAATEKSTWLSKPASEFQQRLDNLLITFRKPMFPWVPGAERRPGLF